MREQLKYSMYCLSISAAWIVLFIVISEILGTRDFWFWMFIQTIIMIFYLNKVLKDEM